MSEVYLAFSAICKYKIENRKYKNTKIQNIKYKNREGNFLSVQNPSNFFQFSIIFYGSWSHAIG